MKFLMLFVTILLFLIEIDNAVSSGIIKDVNGVKNVVITSENNSADTLLLEVFTSQYINYYAPESGSVNLAWKIENFPLEESVRWTENTKITDGLLYTPMEVHGDTFKVHLRVPIGSNLQYYFWITKNKHGAYQEFWDLQSSGNVTVTGATSISKDAVYSKVEKKKESYILSKGWLILFLSSGVYMLLYWVQKRRFNVIESTSVIENVLFLGLSLALIQAFARAEIIGVNPKSIIYDFGVIVKIIRGSFSDFLYVTGYVLLFIIAILLTKNIKTRKLIYWIFLCFALFSTLIAFTNITTVIYLGKPFTYQWLYYSGFLGSLDAKLALRENLSVSIVVNLIAYSLTLLIVASVLHRAYQFVSLQKYFKYITLSLLCFALAVLFIQAYKIEETWTKGQSENAITAMIYSTVKSNSNSSFYSSKIPANTPPFNPIQSSVIEEPFPAVKNDQVKNVLFIVLESAGAVYFDGYGATYKLSPNLNRYANKALMFDQMYAHAPATNRSLVSILGSIYPYLSYKSLTQEAPEVEHPTLSSVLKTEGYRTSFFSSSDLRFQNCMQFLAHHGFDTIEDFSTIKCAKEFQLESGNYSEGNGIDDMCLADRLESWIDEDTTKNFFSMIWTVQGHYPYFFANEEEDFGVSNYNFNRYLNCLKHNDELIGKVMQVLEEKGLASTTLVIVTGDHGEAFGQHKQYGHGTALYEENLKVPLYFINPTLFRGERKSDIAGMKDLATTTLSLLGINPPLKWQGRDLLNTHSNEAFFFAPWSDYLFGYRKDNMKYIFNESQNTVEIYDLCTDPNEKINLFHDGMKDEIVDVRNRMAAWVQFQDKFVKEMLKEED
jgi:phosphoglycerol transferase MdoB-like AlkP superfamily enzyme